MIFNADIHDWESWGRVFQSIPEFSCLTEAILRGEGFSPDSLENLTPGTCAVFKAGNRVVKIFPPKESGMDGDGGFEAEKTMLEQCGFRGIPATKLLASGTINDRYDFSYLITEYADGTEAGDIIHNYSDDEKKRFARKIRKTLGNLHGCPKIPNNFDIVERAVSNKRLGQLDPGLASELVLRARNVSVDEAASVCVHGDITGENVLVSENGGLLLIDFGDAAFAPECYELPPVVFELFRADRVFVREFIGEKDIGCFIEELMDGLSLHDFGAGIIRAFLERNEIPVKSVKSLSELRDIIYNRI